MHQQMRPISEQYTHTARHIQMSQSGSIPLPSDGIEKTMTEYLADITSEAGDIVQSASL